MSKIAIAVLGSHPWCKDGVWQTNGLDGPGDHSGPTFDRFRILAAAYLAKEEHPAAFVIVAGGKVIAEAPTIAEVYAGELVGLGIPSNRIIREDASLNTHQQLVNIGRVGYEQSARFVTLVSNNYHLRRILAMIEHAPGVHAWWKRFGWELVAAEAVMLRAENVEWAQMVHKANADPRMPARLEGEKRGERQIRDGTYRYAPLP